MQVYCVIKNNEADLMKRNINSSKEKQETNLMNRVDFIDSYHKLFLAMLKEFTRLLNIRQTTNGNVYMVTLK